MDGPQATIAPSNAREIEAGMERAGFKVGLLAVFLGGTLAGCNTIGNPFRKDASVSTTGKTGLTMRPAEAQEVLAPDVFQVTDEALWDGRPSLGGVWVAAPDARDPERVEMHNIANGKTVTGALFRRERINPGPALQVSSEAAEALGMLAGQPAQLRVTALQYLEASEPAATAPDPQGAVTTTTLEPPQQGPVNRLNTPPAALAPAPSARAVAGHSPERADDRGSTTPPPPSPADP